MSHEKYNDQIKQEAQQLLEKFLNAIQATCKHHAELVDTTLFFSPHLGSLTIQDLKKNLKSSPPSVTSPTKKPETAAELTSIIAYLKKIQTTQPELVRQALLELEEGPTFFTKSIPALFQDTDGIEPKQERKRPSKLTKESASKKKKSEHQFETS